MRFQTSAGDTTFYSEVGIIFQFTYWYDDIFNCVYPIFCDCGDCKQSLMVHNLALYS